jgi:DNA-binding transcriptional regulator GbsR (MarR family)
MPVSEDSPLRDAKKSLPALQPLDDFPGSLSQKVYMSLKQAILSLAFRPGELMQKSEICKQLGVSRSPVTEAMARLANEGLADIVPQAGTYVTRFSMAEIREGAFLREALELAAVERVATTITEEQLVLLKRNLRIQEALMQDGDTAGFHQMDAELHETDPVIHRLPAAGIAGGNSLDPRQPRAPTQPADAGADASHARRAQGHRRGA